MTKTRAGLIVPAAGGHHRQHARQRLGGGDDGLVAHDGAHGRERVHALGARDAWHEFHGKEAGPGGGRSARCAGLAERVHETDDGLAGAQQFQIGFAGFGILAQAAHLEDHIGGGKDLGAGPGDARAGFGVFGVAVAGGRSGAALDNRLNADFVERSQHGGHQRHAPLAGEALPDDADNHEATLSLAPGARSLILAIPDPISV